jgi:hypothetical protein
MKQVCWSKGKYLTSISHEDLKMAGGVHRTLPVWWSTAFVIVVTTYSPSALKHHQCIYYNLHLFRLNRLGRYCQLKHYRWHYNWAHLVTLRRKIQVSINKTYLAQLWRCQETCATKETCHTSIYSVNYLALLDQNIWSLYLYCFSNIVWETRGVVSQNKTRELTQYIFISAGKALVTY